MHAISWQYQTSVLTEEHQVRVEQDLTRSAKNLELDKGPQMGKSLFQAGQAAMYEFFSHFCHIISKIKSEKHKAETVTVT